jgi:hypothetical protein
MILSQALNPKLNKNPTLNALRKDQTTSKTYTSFKQQQCYISTLLFRNDIIAATNTFKPKQCILVDVAFIDLNLLHTVTIFIFEPLKKWIGSIFLLTI